MRLKSTAYAGLWSDRVCPDQDWPHGNGTLKVGAASAGLAGASDSSDERPATSRLIHRFRIQLLLCRKPSIRGGPSLTDIVNLRKSRQHPPRERAHQAARRFPDCYSLVSDRGWTGPDASAYMCARPIGPATGHQHDRAG